MFAAQDVTFGKPHAHSRCHVDPFVTELEVKMVCTLIQDGKETGVLHSNEDANLKVKVCLKGPLLHHLCGEICVRAHVECIGGGLETSFPSEPPTHKIEGDDGRKCCDPGSLDDEGFCCYEFDVPIPAGTFKATDPDCGEVCCFAVTATTLDRCGNPGHIACWCKGPCVLIHTAPED